MYRFTIKGRVQGVGFRPYIYNACIKRDLSGFVQNTSDGVVVEVSDKKAFEQILKSVPENAEVVSCTSEKIDTKHVGFTIRESAGSGYAEIPPDLYLCEDCLSELHDKNDRRYKYFFITCTNCGPRFTMTKSTPYDRGTTTMGEFVMCKACKREYKDPKNRRYHAQTIACHECGPTLELFKDGKSVVSTPNEAIKKTAELIKAGEIVAIKGVGGFHLACNTKPETITKLKKLTGRSNKPFAVMCRDIDMAKIIATPNPKQEEVLLSPPRPIVLVPKKKNIGSVTELDTVGIMFPYTALHYLLFDHLDVPIVLTSSNQSDEPISTTKEEQCSRYVLDHSRVIANVADDSVVKVIAGHTFYIRRSRGFVPVSIKVPPGEQNILALGAEMNNTFCVYKKEGEAILSQHMGNTSNIVTFEHYKDTVHQFLDFTQISPDLIVCDLHPSYSTSQYAELLSEQLQIPLERVQHHKAHAYGVALEHELDDFVAIVSDGLGYGEDGTIWGGEIFRGNERVGHLEQHTQVGGDSATQYPAKMLFSILRNFLSLEETAKYIQGFFTVPELAILDKQHADGFNSPLTSSCGRILDAVAFLLGLCDERTYEGRPAMLLEAYSFGPLKLDPVIKLIQGPSLDKRVYVLMTTPLFEFLIKNMDKDKVRLAATVQRYLAEGLYEIAKQYEKPIVFSGGCAYNTIMSSYMLEQGVHVNKNIPAGDGGISFGQIAYVLADPRDDFA